tara:strand:+ start:301 stop:1113 length:813 start_codon:yes stop_codon:yes gene_type:complete
MPYYLTKVTNHLKNISKVSRPTFMIEQLSGFVLDKHSLLVAEWLQNISHAMENPQKFAHLILIQPEKIDELTASDASLILHLCPAEAVTAFINRLADPAFNWVKTHDDWLETFDDPEQCRLARDDEEDNEDEDEEEDSDDNEEAAQRLRDYLDREDFENLLEHSGLDDTNKVTELYEDLVTMFTEDLGLYWSDIINVLGGLMNHECLELLKNQDDSLVLSSDDDLSDDDSSDDDEYDSMPELENVDSEEDIIYERVVLPWWTPPSPSIRV